jgi:3-dehydroquinate synthase
VVFLVSSQPLLGLFGERVQAGLAGARAIETLVVPDGESAKTPETAIAVWREMLRRGGKRDSRVVALGGGSVGDLAGFVASTFLRGVAVLQVPTTLLAQVDASVGGKTAIDLPEAKNSVGAFHHPDWVLADSDCLASLPQAELRCGLVEAVKMASLLDAELFSRIERDAELLLAGDAEALRPVVVAAIAAKASVVEDDPEEGGRRRLLNFGHTLGHGLETADGYGGLRHGDAVAHGIRFALRLGQSRGWGHQLAPRLLDVLARLAIPALERVAPGPVIDAMRRDKKGSEAGLAWVLAEELGRGRIVTDIGWPEVEVALAAFLDEAWPGPA